MGVIKPLRDVSDHNTSDEINKSAAFEGFAGDFKLIYHQLTLQGAAIMHSNAMTPEMKEAFQIRSGEKTDKQKKDAYFNDLLNDIQRRARQIQELADWIEKAERQYEKDYSALQLSRAIEKSLEDIKQRYDDTGVLPHEEVSRMLKERGVNVPEDADNATLLLLLYNEYNELKFYNDFEAIRLGLKRKEIDEAKTLLTRLEDKQAADIQETQNGFAEIDKSKDLTPSERIALKLQEAKENGNDLTYWTDKEIYRQLKIEVDAKDDIQTPTLKLDNGF